MARSAWKSLMFTTYCSGLVVSVINKQGMFVWQWCVPMRRTKSCLAYLQSFLIEHETQVSTRDTKKYLTDDVTSALAED